MHTTPPYRTIRRTPFAATHVGVLLVALLLGGLLTACGGDDDDDATRAPDTAVTSAADVSTSVVSSATAPVVDSTTVVETPAGTEVDTSSPTVTTEASVPTESPVSQTTATVVPSQNPPAVFGGDGNAEAVLDGGTLMVPPGATVDVYASDLGEPRFMALAPDGAVLVTDRGGRVLRLADPEGDGSAEVTTLLDGLDNPHGITVHEQSLYVAEETQVVRYAFDASGTSVGEAEVLIDDLPSGGHWSRTVEVGPDGALYVAIGSSCNVCIEEDPRRATIQRYSSDGGAGQPFAVGLRNAVGITFDSEGRLWATNNGRDGMGDDVPPETVNLATEGADFGWPRCHAGTIEDPEFVGETGCDMIAQPSVLMQAHSAPLGLAFLDGAAVPEEWQDDLLVAFHGSWNRSEPTGYKVARLPFENGQPTGEVIDFVSGWLAEDGDVWGRPVDLLVLADGSVLISDDQAGLVYRIAPNG